MSLVIPDDILRAANISALELRREIAILLFQNAGSIEEEVS